MSLLGHPHVHLRETDSTNDRARALALAGAPHGTLVTADHQSRGRGRHGRSWSAPAGSSLLMSLLLRGQDAGGRAGGGEHARQGPASAPLALLAAVSLCDALGGEAQIKWPNDIVVARADGSLAKLAGILVESNLEQGFSVVGIGVNVAVRLQELPLQLRHSAATLGEEPAAIEPLLERLLASIQRRLSQPAGTVLDAWRPLDALRGRQVSWSAGTGVAEGIDEEGRLRVRGQDGSLAALLAGEVTLALNGA